MDMNQLLALLITQGQKLIKEQRRVYRLRGRKLPESTIAQSSPFFLGVAVAAGPPSADAALKNPKFLEVYRATFEDKGMPFLYFTSFAGITYIHTIMLVDEFPGADFNATLFHELVHAVPLPSIDHRKKHWATAINEER